MKSSAYRLFLIVFFLAPAILAACAPSSANLPTATNSSIPVTGQTSTVPVAALPTASSPANTMNSSVGASPTQSDTVSPTTAVTTGVSESGTTYILDASNSKASYAVREQLARLNLPSDAIGTTNGISGQIVVNSDGRIDQGSSKFTVDVSALHTDSSMRDGYVARNILQSDQYPNAVFVPTQATGLPAALPISGNVSFKLAGNLTIRNITKPVTWDVTGTVNNGAASGTATTSFTFEYFGLNQPQVPVVLSVVDKITLTITLTIKPA